MNAFANNWSISFALCLHWFALSINCLHISMHKWYFVVVWTGQNASIFDVVRWIVHSFFLFLFLEQPIFYSSFSIHPFLLPLLIVCAYSEMSFLPAAFSLLNSIAFSLYEKPFHFRSSVCVRILWFWFLLKVYIPFVRSNSQWNWKLQQSNWIER